MRVKEGAAVEMARRVKVEAVSTPAAHELVFIFCRPLCVTLVFSTKGQRYLRIGLAVPLFGSVACLRRMVADEGKISPDQVKAEIEPAVLPRWGGIFRLFSDFCPSTKYERGAAPRLGTFIYYELWLEFTHFAKIH